jgi:hypothetical protein
MLPTSTLGREKTIVLIWYPALFSSVRSEGLAVSGMMVPSGVNGAAFDVTDFEAAALVGDSDGGQFLALFGEDLDAHEIEVVVEIVVGGFFAVEVDGSGSGVLGVHPHLKLFVGWLLKLGVEARSVKGGD